MTMTSARVPLHYAQPVLLALRRLGYDMEYLFRQAGLKSPIPPDGAGDYELPVLEFTKLYSYAFRLLESRTSQRLDAARLNEAHLDEQTVEMMCYCLIPCENLSEVIHRVAVFNRILGPLGSHYALQKTATTARLTMDLHRRTYDDASLLVCLATMNVLHQLFSWLIGRPLALREVTVRSPLPQQPLHMTRSFGTPLKHGQPEDSFSFPAEYLELPVIRNHNDLKAIIHYFSFDIAYSGHHEGALTERITMLILSNLQRTAPVPSSNAVAELYGMSPSSLRRRLRDEGTHFTAVRARCLMGYAEHLLLETGLKIQDIAAQVGFSDDRAFRRAFHQWRGISPSEFRQ